MAHLLRGGERVRPEPGPAVLLDRYRCAPYRPVRVDEMLGEPAGKVLDLTDAVFLGKGVHGVLLRVGRQHLCVVAGQVDVGKVAGECDADRQVAKVVAVTAPGYPCEPDLRLAVLVLAEDHIHGVSSPDRWCTSTGSPAAARGSADRIRRS